MTDEKPTEEEKTPSEPAEEKSEESPQEASKEEGASEDAGEGEAEKEKSAAPKSKAMGMVSDFRFAAMEIVRGLWSRDSQTRKMSFLFFLSCIGLVFSVLYALQVVQTKKEKSLAGEDPALLDEELDSTKVEEKGTKPYFLGSFTVATKPGFQKKNPPGVVNMLEVSVHIECDVDDTCKFIEGNKDRLRDEILRKVMTIDREAALTKDGKRRLKESMLKVINGWLEKGEVRAVYFSKLLVG